MISANTTARRSIGEWLYAIYLGTFLVVGITILVESDIGFVNDTSSSTRYLFLGLVIGTLSLSTASSLSGNMPFIADTPVLLHTTRRRKHIARSLAPQILWKLFIITVCSFALGVVVGQVFVSSLEELIIFAIKLTVIALATFCIAVLYHTRKLKYLYIGTILGVSTIYATILFATQETQQWETELLVRILALAIGSLAYALESIHFSALWSQANKVQTIQSRFYLLTPLDFSLLLRADSKGFLKYRIPVDGALGILRISLFLSASTIVIFLSPTGSYSYPFLAGILSYIGVLDFYTSMRMNVLVHDSSPLTLPLRVIRNMILKRIITSLMIGTSGLLINAFWSFEFGMLMCSLSLGTLAATINVMTRELSLVDLFLESGFELLGLVIVLRIVGPPMLSGLGTIGLYHLFANDNYIAVAIAFGSILICLYSCGAFLRSRHVH